MKALQAYALHAALLGYTVLLLWVDSRLESLFPQVGLGLLTFGLLELLARRHPEQERREMWCCVLFSTAIELFATQVWGLYTYRFGNVPWYVPPGHGLIYLVSLELSRTPLVAEHPRRTRVAVFVGSSAWALGGLWVAPLWGGPRDVHGFLYWPFFAWFLMRSPQGPTYACTFVVTSIIELAGTQFGNWHWQHTMPWLGLPSADPPSLIAGGYCTFALVATAMAGWRPGRAQLGIASAAAPVPQGLLYRRRRT